MQSYTTETPIDSFRKDFIFRGAVTGTVVAQRAELLPVVEACRTIVASIDERKTQLQQLEDDLVRAQALESATKLGAVDAYEMLRKQLAAYDQDKVLTHLPVAPSTLAKLALEKLDFRVTQAINNVKTLAEDHPVRRDFLPTLEVEFAEFQAADLAEDLVRRNLVSMRLALNLFKAELAQARDTQLGQIQASYHDRSKVEYFTRPWRSTSTAKKEEPTPSDA